MREIRALTSLRGLAALYVALLHFSTLAQMHCAVEIPALAPRGQLAVDFFFDLSGFVMGYTYYEGFRARGLAAMPEFLLKRVARIWPLHAFMIVLLVIYTLAVAGNFAGKAPLPAIASDNPAWDIPANLLLLHGLGIAHNINGPSWSISSEFMAYLAFPLILAVVFSRFAAVRALAIALPVIGILAITYDQPTFNLGQLEPRLALVRCFAGFTLGLVAYRWYRQGGNAKRLGNDAVTIALAAAIAAIMVLRLGDIFAAFLFPFMIVAAACNKGVADRVLGSRPLHFLGVISYSIYLIHEPIGHLESQALTAIHPAPLGPAPALVLAGLGALSVIPPAWAIYHLIEKPGRDWIRAAATHVSAAAKSARKRSPFAAKRARAELMK